MSKMKKLGIALLILSTVMPLVRSHGSPFEFIANMTSALALVLWIPGVILCVLKQKKQEAATTPKDPRVRLVSIDNNGGNLPGQSPEAVVWDGDKSAAKNADINKGLF